MKTTQTKHPASHRIPEPAPVWHDFSWTADGHTPKIDVRTPADVTAQRITEGWRTA